MTDVGHEEHEEHLGHEVAELAHPVVQDSPVDDLVEPADDRFRSGAGGQVPFPPVGDRPFDEVGQVLQRQVTARDRGGPAVGSDSPPHCSVPAANAS